MTHNIHVWIRKVKIASFRVKVTQRDCFNWYDWLWRIVEWEMELPMILAWHSIAAATNSKSFAAHLRIGLHTNSIICVSNICTETPSHWELLLLHIDRVCTVQYCLYSTVYKTWIQSNLLTPLLYICVIFENFFNCFEIFSNCPLLHKLSLCLLVMISS